MVFLIMQFSNEDHGKFTQLYKDFHDPLMKYAYSILKDRNLSEEAVQDTFIRVLKNLRKLSDDDGRKTWHYMVIVLRNVSLTMLKKERASIYQDLGENGLAGIAAHDEPIWSEYQAKELYQKITEYINCNLSEIDRYIMILRGVYKMSYKDIAGIVGITESNVSARLSRLRKKMKSDLRLEEISK